MGKGTKRKGGGQREDKERPTSGEEKWGMREERTVALSDLYVYQTRHLDCSGWLSERFRGPSPCDFRTGARTFSPLQVRHAVMLLHGNRSHNTHTTLAYRACFGPSEIKKKKDPYLGCPPTVSNIMRIY